MASFKSRFLAISKSSSFPILLALLVLTGVIWTWRRLPDVVIDFGRELYVPWRLAEGDVLYRDIASFNGPLSYYWLALWYRCLGASLYTLLFANLLVLIATLCLIGRLFALIAGRGAAVLSSITFLGMFAFGHLLPTGNYNWLCPYSHELPHGVFLSLATIYLWALYFMRGDRRLIGLAGFTLGLVFLTKAEVFVAALAAYMIAIAAVLCLEGRRAGLRALVVTALSGFVPPAVAWILLAQAMPAADAWHATLGSWPYVMQSNLTELFYFKWHAGLLDVPASLFSILISASCYVAALLPALLAAMVARPWLWRNGNSQRAHYLITTIVFLWYTATLGTLWFALNRLDMTRFAQPWPLFLLLLTGVSVWGVLRPGADIAGRRLAIVRLLAVLFSFALLARMILNVRISHYGFALAMPATLVVLASFWDWIPHWITTNKGDPRIFRAAVLAGWCVTFGGHLIISHHFLQEKNYIVDRGADSLRADDTRGKPLAEVTEYLEQHAHAGDTLAVLPEGVILNYWLRMPSTTPFVEYHPPALLMYGEDRILRALQQKPPTWIVLVHRDHWEYGASFLGKDYGLAIANWIDRQYAAEVLSGAPPFQSNQFGIMVLKHRSQL